MRKRPLIRVLELVPLYFDALLTVVYDKNPELLFRTKHCTTEHHITKDQRDDIQNKLGPSLQGKKQRCYESL